MKQATQKLRVIRKSRLFIFFLSLFYSYGGIFSIANTAEATGDHYISGIVFYDLNRNGVMDENEYGIGGVYLLHDGKTTITSSDGVYRFTSHHPIDYVTNKQVIELDEDFFRDDFVPTTPTKKTILDIQDQVFGIFYPVKVLRLQPREGRQVRITSYFKSEEFEIQGNVVSNIMEINGQKMYLPEITLSVPGKERFKDFYREPIFRFNIRGMNFSKLRYWRLIIADTGGRIVFRDRKEEDLPQDYEVKLLSAGRSNEPESFVAHIEAITEKEEHVSSNLLVLKPPGKRIYSEVFNAELFNSSRFYKEKVFTKSFIRPGRLNFLSRDYVLVVTHEVTVGMQYERKPALVRLERIRKYAEHRVGFSRRNIVFKLRKKKSGKRSPKVIIEIFGSRKVKIENPSERVIINGERVRVKDTAFYHRLPPQTRKINLDIRSGTGRSLITTLKFLGLQKKKKKVSYVQFVENVRDPIASAKRDRSFIYRTKGRFRGVSKLFIDGEEVRLSNEGRFSVPLELRAGENRFRYRVIGDPGFAYRLTQILRAEFISDDGIFLNLILPEKLDFVLKWKIFVKGFTNRGNQVFADDKKVKVEKDGSFGFVFNAYKKKEIPVKLVTPSGNAREKIFNLLKLINVKGL